MWIPCKLLSRDKRRNPDSQQLVVMKKAGLMDDIVVLEWSFSPSDYFEEPIHIKRDHYVMTIDNGKVEARIDSDAYNKEHKMRDELHDALNHRFLAVQLLTHKPYKLSKASMYRLHPNGRKEVTIFAEPGVVTMSVGTPDFVVKDKDGNIVSDSRKDRIEKKKELADLAEAYRSKDTLVTSLLSSYKAAVNDPDNELVHLYEIRDALATKFGRESAARTALGISAAQWSRLGRLANDEPLRQGRHRGEKVGALRDATEAELKEARSIARSFVKGYLKHLERQNTL